MFKKSLLMVVSLILANVALATDLTLLKNPYSVTSIRLKTEIYAKHMAHPTLTVETINVDAKNQRVLKFSDLVSDQEKALKIIATYSQAYLLKKVNMPADFFKIGTAPLLENYSHWNINSEYLEITFDRAQVTPSYYGLQVVDIPLSLLADVLNPTFFPNLFKLQAGDLLFQDLACGKLCDGINSTTHGYKNTVVSHVGMVVSINNSEPMVIEALSSGVKLTSLNEFLVRSLDKDGHPRVMVGRVNDQTQALIPAAIRDAMHDLNAPYNATFSPDAKGFYCSQ
ncbi:MAG: YiiX/YebB-like N1pC/P60 family cysteine hydrolase, partial [Pseudomonadota bacterium]